ncbi:helix-turn-helix domain-containing protein [Spongiibacter taiwanensis]|uniref:ArsR/SmtB family transcription factor n=1 Tax=Spongiibacter taiwanensis TaxID=1748242 RepID=UPI002034DBB7|nr:helix-turn-helix domain-containing protein [Spongiibacter taiwanensis]USA42292.1 helix-turn-helix domain-containing protein [Spongiibacter taiwanensis]
MRNAVNESAVYKALGDPVRLEMVRRLAGKVCTVGELSADLGVSRQGARKQLQVLVSADVVILQQRGRQTDVSLNRQALKVARDFITQLERQWDDRLIALKDFVEGSE